MTKCSIVLDFYVSVLEWRQHLQHKQFCWTYDGWISVVCWLAVAFFVACCVDLDCRHMGRLAFIQNFMHLGAVHIRDIDACILLDHAPVMISSLHYYFWNLCSFLQLSLKSLRQMHILGDRFDHMKIAAYLVDTRRGRSLDVLWYGVARVATSIWRSWSRIQLVEAS